MLQRFRFKKVFMALALLGLVVTPGLASASAPTTESGVPMVPQNFSTLAEKVGPAVVNIQVEKKTQPAMSPFRGERGGPQDQFRDFFGPRFGLPTPPPQRESGLGTGFIIDPAGYIVTNNHVVDGADQIKVVLQDQRELEAKVVGRDPQTDLALLKVKSDKPLPAVTLGKSADLKVGEWVVAIGNPFGLDHTVTAGIVSAKGRVIGSGPYDDYIQTDASINPGNSGGPLLNMRGQVVGINTAIIASGQGIGFAIPIDMATSIVAQLEKEGEVTRGWLGVTIQDLKGDLADYYGVAKDHGVLVTNVVPGDPADKAGIQANDIITEVDGTQVNSSRELTAKVAALPVDRRVDVTLLREGKEKTVSLNVGRRPVTLARNGKADSESDPTYGIQVTDLTPALARRLNIDAGRGAVVTGVEPGSKADQAGLEEGDVIVEVNRHEVESARDVKDRIQHNPKGDKLDLLVKSGQGGLRVVQLG
jgi:serine protease Do